MFSPNTKHAIYETSASAAPDMYEGGDDPVLVAETVLTVMSCHEKEAYAEITKLISAHGYDAVLQAASKVVGTL